MPDPSVRIVTGRPGLDSLAAGWAGMAAAHGTASYFQTPAWLGASWLASESRGRRPFLVVAGDPAAPDLVWPLQRAGRPGLRAICPLSCEPPYYNDLLLRPGADRAVVDLAWAEVRRHHAADYARFEMVWPDSTLARFLAARGARHTDLAAQRLYLGDHASHAAFFGCLTASMRREIRRSARLLAARGTVGFEVTGRVDDDALAWIVDHKYVRLGRTGGHRGTVGTAWFARLLRDATAAASAGGHLYLARLALDGRPVAMDLGFVWNGVVTGWIRAFDDAFAAAGPGRLLTDRLTRWCFESGHRIYDMMPSDDPYKSRWTLGAGRGEQVRHYYLPLSLRGHVYTGWLTGPARARLRDRIGVHARRRLRRAAPWHGGAPRDRNKPAAPPQDPVRPRARDGAAR